MSTDKTIHASESQHWYTADGKPLYEVPLAKGNGMRPATLRDAKKMNLYFGVSSIIQLAAKPGLQNWIGEQLLLAAMTLPRNPAWSEREWIAAVKADAKAQSEKARERGTAIHAAIEEAYSTAAEPMEFDLEVAAVDAALTQYCPDTVWTPEITFASPMGYGGKIDLYGETTVGASLEPNLITVLDFKTTEFSLEQLETKDKVLAYDEHLMQAAAYANGVDFKSEYKHRLLNLYISTTVRGLVHLHEWTEEDEMRGLKMFLGLLSYAKAAKQHYPEDTEGA